MAKKSYRNAEDDEFGERLDSLDLPDFVLAQVQLLQLGQMRDVLDFADPKIISFEK